MVSLTAIARLVHAVLVQHRDASIRTHAAPGHMGSERVTVQALKVVLVDPERNLLGVHGAVPGGKGGLVVIKEARKQ